MRGCTTREIVFGVVVVVLLGIVGFSTHIIQLPNFTSNSQIIYYCNGIQQSTPCQTTEGNSPSGNVPPNAAPPVATQPPVNNSVPSGSGIPSNSGDSPYTTPNGTAICSGDVSVREPNGSLHSPDNDPTTGEEVAITGSGYTIIFTNSASCTQYPTLTSSQINSILDNIAASQRSSGCSGGCTGQEQRWIFP